MGERAAVKLSFEDLAVLSKSYNGYEREKAVALLDELKDPRALPLLIERLNDWVSVVRLRAEKAFYALLTADNACYYAKYLVDILHLSKRRRHDHNPLIESVINVLILDSNKYHLINAILSPNQKLAFQAFRLCVENELLSNLSLLEHALQSKNIVSIRYALPLIDQLDNDDFKKIQHSLLRQKFSPALIKTIRRLESTNPEMLLAVASPLMFSKSQELRKMGRCYLQLTDAETITLYSNILSDSASSLTKISVALVESAELLNADAIKILQEYALHSSPNIRKLALQQIARILDEQAMPFLVQGLLDESGTVKNESVRLCVKAKIRFTTIELIELYERQPTQLMLGPILCLAKKGGKWIRLAVLLQILQKSFDKPELGKQLNIEISEWNQKYNLSGSQASNAELRALQLLMTNNRNALTVQNKKALNFIFDTLIR